MMLFQLQGHVFARCEKKKTNKEVLSPQGTALLSGMLRLCCGEFEACAQNIYYLLLMKRGRVRGIRQQRKQLSNIRFLNYVWKYAAKRERWNKDVRQKTPVLKKKREKKIHKWPNSNNMCWYVCAAALFRQWKQ